MSVYYLKYRPQKLSDLDLTRVRETLTKIVASGKIPHSLLFAGPRGTGKTSAARILAKVVNCEKPKADGEPCNRCTTCQAITAGNYLDVIELDAASNRGIDDIRALREKIILAPSRGAKKVYILDEAHMLTTEAANALLKTLEEPPSHVLLILATTNPEKLPATVRSRLTNVVFEKAKPAEIARQLTRVMKGENLKAEEGVVEVIAKAADGSFRDAVKILEDLARETKSLKKKTVEEFLFESQKMETDRLLEIFGQKNAALGLELVEKAAGAGVNFRHFVESLLTRLHNCLLAQQGLTGEMLENLTTEETLLLIDLLTTAKKETPTAFIPQLPLELALVKFCFLGKNQETKTEAPKEKPKEQETRTKTTKQTQVSSGKPVSRVAQPVTGDLWAQILTNARAKDMRIEALLRAAHPLDFDGAVFKLGVYYSFHKERLESQAIKQTLEEIMTQVCGGPTRVVYSLTEKTNQPAETLTPTADQDIIEAAKEIFN